MTHTNLTYARVGVAVMYNSATLFGSWSYYNYKYYYCPSSTYPSLTSCSAYTSYGYCGSSDHAGLWCMSVPPAGIDAQCYSLNDFNT